MARTLYSDPSSGQRPFYAILKPQNASFNIFRGSAPNSSRGAYSAPTNPLADGEGVPFPKNPSSAGSALGVSESRTQFSISTFYSTAPSICVCRYVSVSNCAVNVYLPYKMNGWSPSYCCWRHTAPTSLSANGHWTSSPRGSIVNLTKPLALPVSAAPQCLLVPYEYVRTPGL